MNGPMRSERPPLTNQALVADNDRMYHRIGWIGDYSVPTIPTIAREAQIEHTLGNSWTISCGSRVIKRYSAEQIRISILWKARVATGGGGDDADENSSLTPERIVELFVRDLRSRSIRIPTPESPLSDQTWLNLIHSTYYSPVEAAE
jgi:hypothetical protein